MLSRGVFHNSETNHKSTSGFLLCRFMTTSRPIQIKLNRIKLNKIIVMVCRRGVYDSGPEDSLSEPAEAEKEPQRPYDGPHTDSEECGVQNKPYRA